MCVFYVLEREIEWIFEIGWLFYYEHSKYKINVFYIPMNNLILRYSIL